jgi:CheY-like chemotaxis protein
LQSGYPLAGLRRDGIPLTSFAQQSRASAGEPTRSASRRLKGNPQTRDIPIIALSAHALAGEREKALAAGCNEFDTKPIEFDRLVATVRRILANRK